MHDWSVRPHATFIGMVLCACDIKDQSFARVGMVCMCPARYVTRISFKTLTHLWGLLTWL